MPYELWTFSLCSASLGALPGSPPRSKYRLSKGYSFGACVGRGSSTSEGKVARPVLQGALLTAGFREGASYSTESPYRPASRASAVVSCPKACHRVYLPLFSTASYIHTFSASSSSCTWRSKKTGMLHWHLKTGQVTH